MAGRYERNIAEQIAERMVRRHRSFSCGYRSGWGDVSRLSHDHTPGSLLTLRPYYGRKAHPVRVFWFKDGSGLAAHERGDGRRAPVPLDRFGINRGAILCDRRACRALMMGNWEARGVNETKADEMLALWLEFYTDLTPVNSLTANHIARLLQSNHSSVRVAAMCLRPHRPDGSPSLQRPDSEVQ